MHNNNNNKQIQHRSVNSSTTVINTLKQMDDIGTKLLLVIDSGKFVGLISAGDIQRAIINNISLSTSIIEILRDDIKVAFVDDPFTEIKEMMTKYRMELCPVIDKNNEIVKLLLWEDLFSTESPEPFNKFNLPIVVMAGGFGTRLQPLTHVLPKPLIPIGKKTILQEIYDRFHQYGCNSFYTSVNYKADFIEDYVSKLGLPYKVEFFREDKPMGTAGSLQLLKNKINETFFVHNCDILIENDYSEILDYHRSNKNELTVIAALKHLGLPYGTLETGKNGKLLSFSEKPEMTFKINTGMYILEPHLLQEIPEDSFFHITDLIKKIKTRGGNVGVYPVSEDSWKDIGNWSEYLKFIKK